MILFDFVNIVIPNLPSYLSLYFLKFQSLHFSRLACGSRWYERLLCSHFIPCRQFVWSIFASAKCAAQSGPIARSGCYGNQFKVRLSKICEIFGLYCQQIMRQSYYSTTCEQVGVHFLATPKKQKKKDDKCNRPLDHLCPPVST